MDKEKRYKELLEQRSLRVVSHPCWETNNDGDQVIVDYCGMIVTYKQGTIEVFDTITEAQKLLDTLYDMEPVEGAKLLCERGEKAYKELCERMGWNT